VSCRAKWEALPVIRNPGDERAHLVLVAAPLAPVLAAAPSGAEAGAAPRCGTSTCNRCLRPVHPDSVLCWEVETRSPHLGIADQYGCPAQCSRHVATSPHWTVTRQTLGTGKASVGYDQEFTLAARPSEAESVVPMARRAICSFPGDTSLGRRLNPEDAIAQRRPVSCSRQGK